MELSVQVFGDYRSERKSLGAPVLSELDGQEVVARQDKKTLRIANGSRNATGLYQPSQFNNVLRHLRGGHGRK